MVVFCFGLVSIVLFSLPVLSFNPGFQPKSGRPTLS